MGEGESYLLDINLQVSNAKAFDELSRNLAVLNTQTKQVGTTQKQLATTTKQVGSAWSGAQYQVYNVSYQLTDFFVMLQGGMGVMRSLSTQLPQLLAGFGALGAVAGLAVAALSPVVALLFNFEDASDIAEAAADDLATVLGYVDDELISMNSSMVKLTQNRALESQKKLALELQKEMKEVVVGASAIFGDERQREMASLAHEQVRIEKGTKRIKDRQELVNQAYREMLYGGEELYDQFQSFFAEVEKGTATFDQLDLLMSQAITSGSEEAQDLALKLGEVLAEVLKLNEGMKGLKSPFGDFIKDLESTITKFNEAGLSQSEVFQKQLNSLLGLTDAQKAQAQGLIDQIAVLEEIADIEKGLAEFEKEVAEDRKEYQDLYKQAIDATLTPAKLLANETARVTQEMRQLGFTDEQIEKVTTFLEESANKTQSLGESIQDRLVASTDEAASAMQEFAAGNKKAFSDMAKSIIKDITAMILQYYLLRAAQALTGVKLGPNGTALTSANAGTSTNSAFAARALPLSTTVALPLAVGHSRTIPATPRAASPISNIQDTNLSAIQPNVNVNVSNYTNAEVTTTQNQNGDIELIISQVTDRIRRGGNALSKSLEGVYGVSRAKGAF